MTLFVQKNQKVRGGRRLPKLFQERSYLTAVVGGMIDDVLQHMSQRVLPSPALKVLVWDADVQKFAVQAFQESLLLVLHRGPVRVKRHPIVEVLWSKNLLR